MKTYDLKTAYMRNPMGLDDLHPQLSWETMNIVKVPKCDIRWTVLKRLFE